MTTTAMFSTAPKEYVTSNIVEPATLPANIKIYSAAAFVNWRQKMARFSVEFISLSHYAYATFKLIPPFTFTDLITGS